MSPDWLPLPLNLTGSSLANDYKSLYHVFEQDFISSPLPVVDGCRVVVNNVLDRSIMGGIYAYGFTHLVTHGAGERYIDYDRATKLPWVRAVLDNYNAPEVTAFYMKQVSGETLYLWLVDFDFVVILRPLKSKKERENPTKKIIVTAYHVNSYGKRDLQGYFGRSTRQL